MDRFVLIYILTFLGVIFANPFPYDSNDSIRPRQVADDGFARDLIPSQDELIAGDEGCTPVASTNNPYAADENINNPLLVCDETQESVLSRRGGSCAAQKKKIGSDGSIDPSQLTAPAPVPRQKVPKDSQNRCKKYPHQPLMLTCNGPEISPFPLGDDCMFVIKCRDGKSFQIEMTIQLSTEKLQCSKGDIQYRTSLGGADLSESSEFCCRSYNPKVSQSSSYQI